MEQIEISEITSIINSYSVEKKFLIPILQDIQAKYNYLPGIALTTLSKILGIPLIDIISIASFYNAFSLTPRGEHVITVCMGTACHVRGAPQILDEFKRKLGIEVEQTTVDNKFTLETVNCLGACALGPIAVIDKNYHGQMQIRKVDKLIKKYSSSKEDKSSKE
jgi:NADH:ubiquinone oxidoreductase subunit E